MNYTQVKCHLKLLFCILLMSFSQVLVGSSYVFSSTLFDELREPSSKIKLNTDEESWIASVSVLVCPIGLLVIGVLTDRFGKRIALQIALIPMTSGWLLLSLADSYKTILTARILLGFPLGVCSCMFLYVAEICPANLRSIYSAFIPMLVGFGMMAESVLSVYVNWQTISRVMCVTSAINFFALFAVPEPPAWLRSKGRGSTAARVDEWLDLKHVDAAAIAASDHVPEDKRATASPAVDASRDSPSFLGPTIWKPTLITLAFFLLQQCSGMFVLTFYCTDVLRSFRVPWDGVTVSVFLGAARVLGTVCFAGLYRVRRKTLVAISGAVMSATLLTIVAGVHAFDDVQDQPPALTAALVAAFVAYMYSSMLGILPIPWVLCGEVFPMAVKGVMNGIVQTCGYLFWFMVCKLYPLMILEYGAEVVWSVFAFFCVLNVLFAVFIMPETKGKTLDEILSYFDSSKTTKILNTP